MVFETFYQACRPLSLQERRVLDVMMANMGYGNRVRISQSAIAGDMGVARQSVSKAVQALRQHNIVQDVADARGGRFFRINPLLAYKGAKTKNVAPAKEAGRRMVAVK